MKNLVKIKNIEKFVMQYMKDNDLSEPVKIFDLEYDAIDVLKEVDPVAFRELILNEIDYLVKEGILIVDDKGNYFFNDK